MARPADKQSSLLFAFNLAWAVYSNFFGRKPPQSYDDDDEEDDYLPSVYDPQKALAADNSAKGGRQWQMDNLVPQAYGNHSDTPFTPRTQAFHALGGMHSNRSDLPLRQS